jgi:hypothetical protein
VLFVPLLLSACVTDQLNSGFERMRGQSISVAIDRLGVPTSERRIAGRHVYTWTTSQLVSTYQPTTSITTGTVPTDSGKSRYSGTTLGGTTVQTNATCKIEAEVDTQEFIRQISYDGTVNACAKFAQALNR